MDVKEHTSYTGHKIGAHLYHRTHNLGSNIATILIAIVVYVVLLQLFHVVYWITIFKEVNKKCKYLQNLQWFAIFMYHIEYNMPGPGIEPRTMACQAEVLPTTVPRLSTTTIAVFYYY